MKSIKTKILTVVISGLLVITAVVSMISVNMTHEILHKDADRILNNVAQKEAAYINDTLGDIKKSSAIMEHFATTEIENANQLRDPQFLTQYLENNKNMFMEVALNTSGIEGFFMRLSPELTNSTTGFYSIITPELTVKDLQITDLSKYPKNDKKNVGWYYTAVDAGAPVWLDPYFFPGYEAELISYTVPLYVNSELIGVIGFDMNFSYLLQKIEKISVYEHGSALLLSKDGNNYYNKTETENSDNPHTKASVPLLNGMILELSADYKDIQRDTRPMMINIVIAFLVVLFFAILYTIFVTSRIVHPLKHLTAVAQGIASGKNDVKLSDAPINSKDEVGTLSKVLISTYEKIQEYTAYINALAYKDSLTGIKNSTAYTEAIAKINEELNINTLNFGVLVADINNLKQTNDKFGHDIGNELIIHTSRVLSSIFKTSSVFRIGGDEFAVILKGKDYDSYRDLIKQLDDACKEDVITVADDKITLSIARGVALYNHDIDKIFEDVFAKADHAMYLHKKESKMALV